MNTPIVDFVKSYESKNALRLHMPGHKGKTFLGPEKYDITEIDGADVLYSPDGIIEESENNASSLFGTRHTYYSTEGSSLCIRAMVYLACLGKEKPLIIAGRNVHKAFIYAAALCDCEVKWIFEEDTSHLCSCRITADNIRKALNEADRKPVAVYLTSPDYLGNMLDTESIGEVCKSFGVPLLVDNAHGAYLNFLPENQHPIKLGASMCCDSAHKTLPVLTGGAYLHISESAPESFFENARAALSLFASTSPSYLILQSLDLCNAYLSTNYGEKLKKITEETDSLKSFLTERGYSIEGNEKLKITVSPLSFGYTGYELSEKLKEHNIYCEFYDRDYLVMMFSAETEDSDFDKIKKAFSLIERKEALKADVPETERATKQAVSIRQAVFSPTETVPVSESAGRICAVPTVSCPPAIPVAVSGEVITEKAVRTFIHYGIKEIKVLK